jgi:hypothetical protein
MSKKVLIAAGGQSQQASLECRPFRHPIEFLFARSPAGTFRVYTRRRFFKLLLHYTVNPLLSHLAVCVLCVRRCDIMRL